MDAPYVGNGDAMADSGTALNLLKQKYPGMFADAATPPAPDPAFAGANSAPTVPASTAVDPNSIAQPDIGNGNKADKLAAVMQGGLSAARTNKFNLPWLPGYVPPGTNGPNGPTRPPMTTGTGQMVPGLTPGQKFQVLIGSALKGAMAGRASSEQAVVQSGGRRSGGAGLGFEAGFNAPAQETATQQALQRGALENQGLQNQTQFAPALNFLKLLQGQAEVGKAQAETGKATAETGKATAETGKATAETAAIPTKQALEQAQAEAANYKEDPNLGLIDLRTKQPVSNAAAAPLTAEEAQVLGKQEGERVPLKLKNTANEIVNRGYTTVNTEQGVYEHKRGTAGPGQRLGDNPREISLDTPVGALDSSTGRQVMISKKDMINSPGRYQPVSADVSTPVIKQTLKDYASTKTNTAGGQVIAFNTAILHLGLLSDAAEALGNGNKKLFNSLSQKWKEQTGSPLPGTFDTIKQMASGEITKVGGSLNQGEQEAVKGPLDRSNSPQALKGSIGASVQLMDGKISILHQHYVDIMHEEPDAPLVYPEAQKVRDRLLGQGGGGNSGGHVIALGGKQYRYNGSGDTADIKNYSQVSQ
jgi:hypothetical protein